VWGKETRSGLASALQAGVRCEHALDVLAAGAVVLVAQGERAAAAGAERLRTGGE
jgi:hypothetical protein